MFKFYVFFCRKIEKAAFQLFPLCYLILSKNKLRPFEICYCKLRCSEIQSYEAIVDFKYCYIENNIIVRMYFLSKIK